MDTPGKRLDYFLEKEGISPAQFGKEIGVAGKSIKEITMDKRPLGGIVLKKIGETYTNLSLSWLLSNVGEMYLHSSVKNVVFEPEPDYKKDDPGKEMLMKYLDDPEIINKIYQHLTNKTK